MRNNTNTVTISLLHAICHIAFKSFLMHLFSLNRGKSRLNSGFHGKLMYSICYCYRLKQTQNRVFSLDAHHNQMLLLQKELFFPHMSVLKTLLKLPWALLPSSFILVSWLASAPFVKNLLLFPRFVESLNSSFRTWFQ